MSGIAWAAAFAVIFVIAFYRFPDEWKAIFRAIANLLQKTKKVGLTGIEAQENPPPPNPDERKAVEDFFRSFDNPVLREQEDAILADLKGRRIDAAHDRERALLRSLASTQVILHFERVHGSMWASQYSLLGYLNQRHGGADQAEILPFYDAARTTYGAIYDNYPFENWLGYLKSYKLIAEKNDRIFVSVAGREYLQYVVATGKTAPTFG